MKNKNILYAAPVVLVIIVGFINSYIVSGKINKHPKYTTAVLINEYVAGKRTTFDYNYNIKGIKYTNAISSNKVEIGEKYLVVYDSLNPKNCALLLIYPIEKDYKPTSNGWKYNEVPFKIDTVLIQKYVKNYN
ncbi:hypothetical protein SAMN05660477_02844 [Soonwooa buanensis]|uniref:Uncharacterized protein n=1 Tax=Soonwooa buanensis TaxID=619805 RepID=A0A1T5GHS0_9FLAO|nr:hypothetical protein [Soonwooa buanensis]SKC07939.1 hypothetical protein SAMN05660477_02844 [Soonwooa buanensis]